jgi:hypothetical protein
VAASGLSPSALTWDKERLLANLSWHRRAQNREHMPTVHGLAMHDIGFERVANAVALVRDQGSISYLKES